MHCVAQRHDSKVVRAVDSREKASMINSEHVLVVVLTHRSDHGSFSGAGTAVTQHADPDQRVHILEVLFVPQVVCRQEICCKYQHRARCRPREALLHWDDSVL